MKKINLELELEDDQEITIKINSKNNKIKIEEKLEEEKIVEWIFRFFPEYRTNLPPKGSKIYELFLLKIIDDFSKGIKG